MAELASNPAYHGCEWPVDDTCFGETWDLMDIDVRDRSLAMASMTLRRLTGYRVGGCPITVRPCNTNGPCAMIPYWDGSGGSWSPAMTTSGAWINSCGCAGSCGCSTACEIILPGPVGEVYEVKVDGVVVPETDYQIQSGNILVYTGAGECKWPATQDLSKPDTQAGTFSVKYLNGFPVDGTGAYAAAVLAMEFAKACTGKGKCELPSTVTSVVRNGVSFQVVSGMFPDGRTGIRSVDAYIAIWNPRGLQREASVWTPDLQRFRHRTS